MIVVVDGVERNWVYDEDMTLSDAIMEINSLLLNDERRVIVGIKVDDENMDEDLKRLTPDQVTLDRVERVCIDTQLFEENIAEQFSEAGKSLQNVVDNISVVVGHILSEELDIAMTTLQNIIERLIQVFSLLTQASSTNLVRMNEISCGDSNFEEFMSKFNTTLHELTEAMENNDTTLISDFLEYELEPRVGELKEAMSALHDMILKSNCD
jgi:hypothetical protein